MVKALLFLINVFFLPLLIQASNWPGMQILEESTEKRGKLWRSRSFSEPQSGAHSFLVLSDASIENVGVPRSLGSWERGSGSVSAVLWESPVCSVTAGGQLPASDFRTESEFGNTPVFHSCAHQLALDNLSPLGEGGWTSSC